MGATLIAGVGTLLATPAIAEAPANLESSAVIDNADLLTRDQENQISEAFVEDYELYDLAFVLETEVTLAGENPETYAVARANELGVGEEGKDNGVYILIVSEDRAVRIEPGDGVAAKVSSAQIQDVIDETIIPGFRAGDFTNSVINSADEIGNIYIGKAEASGPVTFYGPEKTYSGADVAIPLALVCFVVLLIALIFGLASSDGKEFFKAIKTKKLKKLIPYAPEEFYTTALGGRRNILSKKLLGHRKSSVRSSENNAKKLINILLVERTKVKSKDYSLLKLTNVSSEILNLKENETVDDAIASIDEKAIELNKEMEAARERDIAKAAAQKEEARIFWESLTQEQKNNVKNARYTSEKESLLSTYDSSGRLNMYLLLPLMYSMYSGQVGQLTTKPSSTSSSSSSSFNSSTTFGGGSFTSGNGGGGSW